MLMTLDLLLCVFRVTISPVSVKVWELAFLGQFAWMLALFNLLAFVCLFFNEFHDSLYKQLIDSFLESKL